MDIALQQYERGLISYQPLLDSQRALVVQQDTLTESRGLVAADLVAIYRAMGGGWQARLSTRDLQADHDHASMVPAPGAPPSPQLPPPPPTGLEMVPAPQR